MDVSNNPDLARLLALLENIGHDGCEAIGLLPMPDLRHCGYSVAPPNSLAFASTGGDGVHFSLLERPDVEQAMWPVVMTVPMNFDMPNLILGSDIGDFLGLGIRLGYFDLEQLVYDREETISLLDRNAARPSRSNIKDTVLGQIEAAFSCRPWDNHGLRIDELQAAFPLG